MKGLRIPKLLSYDKVKEFIDNIFHNVKYHVWIFYDLDESLHINGAYREIVDLLIELANLFIFIDQTLGDKSHIFRLQRMTRQQPG